jgi:ornithine cyclodeaminase
MNIIHLPRIKEIVKSMDLIPLIEKGFIAYSEGAVVTPPIGELRFENPSGDMHIKYGCIKNDDYYVVKIASGFYENPKNNLPSSNGLMLLFSQKTGELLTILLDEGYLTNIRTAVAGAIAAQYLAPRSIHKIGIIGTGTQARLQLKFLKLVVQCRNVVVYGIDEDNLAYFKVDMEKEGFSVKTTRIVEDITSDCRLIVTATPSSLPILFSHQIKKGTHITAVGADSPHKQELHENIFGIADIIAADSISQCVERGDISHAIKSKTISVVNILELGDIISGRSKGRVDDNQITVADLTGLAVQDIQIAKAVSGV